MRRHVQNYTRIVSFDRLDESCSRSDLSLLWDVGGITLFLCSAVDLVLLIGNGCNAKGDDN